MIIHINNGIHTKEKWASNDKKIFLPLHMYSDDNFTIDKPERNNYMMGIKPEKSCQERKISFYIKHIFARKLLLFLQESTFFRTYWGNHVFASALIVGSLENIFLLPFSSSDPLALHRLTPSAAQLKGILL